MSSVAFLGSLPPLPPSIHFLVTFELSQKFLFSQVSLLPCLFGILHFWMSYFLSPKMNHLSLLCPSGKLTTRSRLQAPCTSPRLLSQAKAFALLLAFFISLRIMNSTISWLLQPQLPLTFITISSVLVRSRSTKHLPYLDCPASGLKKPVPHTLLKASDC